MSIARGDGVVMRASRHPHKLLSLTRSQSLHSHYPRRALPCLAIVWPSVRSPSFRSGLKPGRPSDAPPRLDGIAWLVLRVGPSKTRRKARPLSRLAGVGRVLDSAQARLDGPCISRLDHPQHHRRLNDCYHQRARHPLHDTLLNDSTYHVADSIMVRAR